MWTARECGGAERRDFGVDRFGASFIPRALRSAELRSILAIVAERWDHCPVAARRKSFEAEINADLAVACSCWSSTAAGVDLKAGEQSPTT